MVIKFFKVFKRVYVQIAGKKMFILKLKDNLNIKLTFFKHTF